MKYGIVKYCDCMEKLPYLEDDCIDLALTDPPFNIDYEGRRGSNEIYYEDEMIDYKDWCESWFNELKRICKAIIITPGNLNLGMWFDIEEPRDYGFNYKPNSQSMSSASYLNRFDVYIYYGELLNGKRLHENVIRSKTSSSDYIHPCPKSYGFFEKIIKWLRPESVIDPFLGSGTTGAIAEKYRIRWLGFEKNEVYKEDIERRMSNVKYIPKQINMFDIT